VDSTRFDRLARAFAHSKLTRRSAISGTALGVAGALTGSVVARAQGTPTPSDTLAADGSTLFVQTAAGGTFLPNPEASPEAGQRGTHLLTLAGHPGQTIFFSDRPERTFGQAPTEKLLGALGFTPDNPPNAALVVSTLDGEDDILVLELLDPTYDETAGLLIYEANILGEYAGENLAPVADRQQDDQLASEFDHASLFIDDCPDLIYCCYHPGQWPNGCPIGSGIHVGTCWNTSTWFCDVCDPNRDYGALCDQTYPECNGQCEAHYAGDVCFC
jgi:hypothetical protein